MTLCNIYFNKTILELTEDNHKLIILILYNRLHYISISLYHHNDRPTYIPQPQLQLQQLQADDCLHAATGHGLLDSRPRRP